MLFRIWKNKTVKEKSIGTKYRWIKVVEGTQGTKKVEQPYSLRKNYILPSSMLLKGECSFGDK